MALTYSFPGVTTLASTTDARKAFSGLIAKDSSGNVRTGLFPRHANNIVTGTANLNVDIAAYESVMSQFGGAIFAANDGTTQVLLAAPGSGSNYYVVYAKQNESTAPGTDITTTRGFDKVLSTTSFAAARATLPTGALELATVQVPSGTTATNSGATITQTFLYTATAGGVVWVRNSTEETAWTPSNGNLAYRMDTSAIRLRSAGAWGDMAGSSNRQLDTTNSTISHRIQTGIGKWVGNNADWENETVTFPVAFSATPSVTISFMGRRSTGSFNPTGLTLQDGVFFQAQEVSTTTFKAQGERVSGSLSSSYDWYYSWIAVGAI